MNDSGFINSKQHKAHHQVIELTVRNWDEVYEDLSKRLKVKPQGGAVMSKHLKMAGQLSSP